MFSNFLLGGSVLFFGVKVFLNMVMAYDSNLYLICLAEATTSDNVHYSGKYKVL